MKTTQKALSSAQKRQRLLCAKRAEELAQAPTPEVVAIANQYKEYLL